MKFTGLKEVLRTFDEHGWKGSFTRGLWEIGNGGYDCWFELYYKSLPVARCVAGKLESNVPWVDDVEKEKMFNKILEVYDHLKVQKFEDNYLENEETINIWFDNLLESLGKSNVEELTHKEIFEEIEEIKGTISNERLWEKGYDGKEPINPHSENIATLLVYLEKLNVLLDKASKKRTSLNDVISSCEEVSKKGNGQDRKEPSVNKER